jgi:hypothetical protein
MQLIQVPMMVGASYMATISLYLLSREPTNRKSQSTIFRAIDSTRAETCLQRSPPGGFFLGSYVRQGTQIK